MQQTPEYSKPLKKRKCLQGINVSTLISQDSSKKIFKDILLQYKITLKQ